MPSFIQPSVPRVGLLQGPLRPLVKPMFRTLAVAASGLTAQRVRLATIAGNIANAEVTRTDEGGPYRRRVVQLQATQVAGAPFATPMAGVLQAPGTVGRFPEPTIGGVLAPDVAHGVQVAGIVEDPSEGPLVYDPGHPDADPAGYVRHPNVRLTDEMVDLMDARRVFEANATVFQSAKQMLRRALDI